MMCCRSLHVVIIVQSMDLIRPRSRLYFLPAGPVAADALDCLVSVPEEVKAGVSRSPVMRSCIVVSRLSILFDISFTMTR